MTSQPRPARCIWLTDQDYDDIVGGGWPSELARERVMAAWRDAPADAAEAVRAVIRWPPMTPPMTTTGGYTDQHIAAVLRALGYPHTEHADPAPPTENT